MQPVTASPDAVLDLRTVSASFIHFPDAPEPWAYFPPPPRAPVPPARLQRLASLIHELGPRPLYELFCELVAGRDPLPRIEAYAELDGDIVAALGGDRLPSLRPVQ